MRWLIVFLLACVIFNSLQGWLQRIGLGRLPGDFRFRLGKREFLLPFTSTLLLTAIAFLIGQLI